MSSNESLKRKAIAELLVYSITDDKDKDEDEIAGRQRKKGKRQIGLEDVRKKDFIPTLFESYCLKILLVTKK